jgi:hypothetical protein
LEEKNVWETWISTVVVAALDGEVGSIPIMLVPLSGVLLPAFRAREDRVGRIGVLDVRMRAFRARADQAAVHVQKQRLRFSDCALSDLVLPQSS